MLWLRLICFLAAVFTDETAADEWPKFLSLAIVAPEVCVWRPNNHISLSLSLPTHHPSSTDEPDDDWLDNHSMDHPYTETMVKTPACHTYKPQDFWPIE